MLIIFSGLPGTGKSSIASVLAKKINAFYIRIDTIEQTLASVNGGGKGSDPSGYVIAYALCKENIANNPDAVVITDSVNATKMTRDHFRKIAISVHKPFIEREVICSDKNEHRKRVENRCGDIEGMNLPNWERVMKRKYEKWDREHLVIDSAKFSIQESVELILNRLKKT